MLVKQFTFKLLLISGTDNSVNSDSCFVKENAFGTLWIKTLRQHFIKVVACKKR